MQLSTPGNLVFIEGDDRAKFELHAGSADFDDFLYELADETAFFGAERIKEHAPGHIDQLVGVEPATELEAGGAFEAIAGVEPDITQETFHRGLGSDPADFPVFVEVGTGIFGPVGTSISTIPGHLMGPFWDPWSGRDVFTNVVRGQKPQHFTENAYHDLIRWLPGRIKLGLQQMAATH